MPRLSTIVAYAAASLVCAGECTGAAGLETRTTGDALRIRDINGVSIAPFQPAGVANVLLFVSRECPISNAYAPEIQRLCGEYRARAVACMLVYEEWDDDVAAVRAHVREYGYTSVAAAVDGNRTIARRAHATVTPQAVVIDRAGAIRYRGRIDNRYVAFGTPRRHVTVHDLTDAIEAVLTNQSVVHPETDALGCSITPTVASRKER